MTRKMLPTGLRLEPEVLAQLRASERGLSDEIRDRLQRTLAEDALDPIMRELRDALLNIAALVRIDCGDWHSSPNAHKEFVTAVTQRLAGYTPLPRDNTVAVASDLMEQPDPEMLGKIREQDDRRWHSYPHLEAAAKRTRVWTTRNLGAKQEGGDNG